MILGLAGIKIPVDTGCLALLNPAFGRATWGGIQQGEVSACPQRLRLQTRRAGILDI